MHNEIKIFVQNSYDSELQGLVRYAQILTEILIIFIDKWKSRKNISAKEFKMYYHSILKYVCMYVCGFKSSFKRNQVLN